MLAPLTPFQAYRCDLDRFGTRTEFGDADTVWLLLTHCLSRMSRVGSGVREEIALHSSEALRDLLDSDPDGAEKAGAHHHDLRLLIGGLAAIETGAGSDAVLRGCRGFASRMSESGAHALSYTLMDHARLSAPHASERERGLAAAEQAKYARQLGDLDGADQLYSSAATIGERSGDRELMARSILGRGVIARVSGNYPRSRQLFERGLKLAQDVGSVELQYYARQGLTIMFGVAKDFGAAMENGWEAFRLAQGDNTKEAESLTNLAQVCLDAGFPEAALRGFMGSLARCSVLRVRASALAGAVIAAGRAGRDELVHRIEREAQGVFDRTALPYENARLSLALSCAHRSLGNDIASERHRQDALSIARSRFHEIEYDCSRPEIRRAATNPVPPELTNTQMTAVSQLSTFEVESDETAFLTICSG